MDRYTGQPCLKKDGCGIVLVLHHFHSSAVGSTKLLSRQQLRGGGAGPTPSDAARYGLRNSAGAQWSFTQIIWYVVAALTPRRGTHSCISSRVLRCYSEYSGNVCADLNAQYQRRTNEPVNSTQGRWYKQGKMLKTFEYIARQAMKPLTRN